MVLHHHLGFLVMAGYRKLLGTSLDALGERENLLRLGNLGRASKKPRYSPHITGDDAEERLRNLVPAKKTKIRGKLQKHVEKRTRVFQN